MGGRLPSRALTPVSHFRREEGSPPPRQRPRLREGCWPHIAPSPGVVPSRDGTGPLRGPRPCPPGAAAPLPLPRETLKSRVPNKERVGLLAPTSWTMLWPPASDRRTRPPASSPSGRSPGRPAEESGATLGGRCPPRPPPLKMSPRGPPPGGAPGLRVTSGQCSEDAGPEAEGHGEAVQRRDGPHASVHRTTLARCE